MDGVVVNRAIWIGAWVTAGHGTCPVVQILLSPLSTGIFFQIMTLNLSIVNGKAHVKLNQKVWEI
jgi:hypothetical protein